MITKTVTNGERTAQATISEETRFIFSDMWNFFHVQNMGTGTVYISMVEGKSGGDDGVITVLPGCTACSSHNFPANAVYITADTATDVIQVVGSNSAFLPFKSAQGGGGSSGTVTWGSIVGKPTFAGVALSGIYADLLNKPSIPIVDSELSLLSTNAIENAAVATALQELEEEIDSMTGGVSYVGYFGTLTDRNSYVGTLTEGNWCTVNTDSDYSNKKTKYVYSALTSAWAYNGEVSDTAISIDDTAGLGDTAKALSADQITRRIAECAPVSSAHYHTNKTVLDNTTASFTTAKDTKLSGIADNANNYTLPTASTDTLGGVKIDGTSITIADGVISAPGGGGGVTVDTALSASSTNPVQNKAVYVALEDKAATDHTQAADKGGTGQTSYTVGDILYANTTSTLAKLSAGAVDTVLTSNGAGAAPSWETPSSGGGITQTLLFNGAVNTTDVYTLSAAYTGFKFLIIGAIYSADELFNAIINCADIRATPDYSKRNSLYVGSNRVITVNTNGVNFKTLVAFSYCKIYGVK